MQLTNNKFEKQYQNICLWLVVGNLFPFQKLLSSNFLIKSFMSTPQTHKHDMTLMCVLKSYAQV